MLAALVPDNLFAVLLVFARVGSAVMLLPGFGEIYVSARVRLLIALAIAIVLTPVVGAQLPAAPVGAVATIAAVIGEVVVGLFIGALTRFLLSALHIAGVVIGYQTTLGNATLFDPTNAQQGSMIAAFLNLLGVFAIFAADLHHLMLRAIADSYTVFRPGDPFPVGDFSEAAARALADSFRIAMQIAAPFVVVAVIFYLCLGLIARLMPQVQVFFIAVPLQITIGFLVMAFTLSAGITWFLTQFEGSLTSLFGLQ